MDERTLTALKGSIRKWKKIVAGTGKDDSIRNCPLCKLFWDKGCTGCPVAARTDTGYCRDTPFDQWIEHQEKMHPGEHACYVVEGCTVCASLAQTELDFLKSLLPNGDPP